MRTQLRLFAVKSPAARLIAPERARFPRSRHTSSILSSRVFPPFPVTLKPPAAGRSANFAWREHAKSYSTTRQGRNLSSSSPGPPLRLAPAPENSAWAVQGQSNMQHIAVFFRFTGGP